MKSVITTKAVWPTDLDNKKTRQGRLMLVATFLIPALIVIGILYLLVTFRGGIEAGVADLALLLPIGYAFAAGMVASVNPCGVLMLTSYVFYHMRDEGSGQSAARRLSKGLLLAAVITSGFIVIFAIAGSIISVGGQWLISVFPYAGLIIGAAMAGLGVWLLLSRKTLGITAAKKVTVNPESGLGNAFLFGVAYAIGSLSCTLPIFLVVVGSSLTGGGWLASLWQYIGYALGMGAIILFVMVGAALFRRAMARWLRSLTPFIHHLSAIFLIGAGLYLAYYWLFQANLGV